VAILALSVLHPEIFAVADGWCPLQQPKKPCHKPFDRRCSGSRCTFALVDVLGILLSRSPWLLRIPSVSTKIQTALVRTKHRFVANVSNVHQAFLRICEHVCCFRDRMMRWIPIVSYRQHVVSAWLRRGSTLYGNLISFSLSLFGVQRKYRCRSGHL
jgi:hypothetical protein